MIYIREDISIRQGFVLIFIFMTGGIMAIGGNSDAGRDGYLSAIFAILFVVPLFWIYYKPFIIFKKLNYFEIIALLYGEKLSKVVNFIMCISVFFVACISMARFTIFLKSVALDKTPVFTIGIFMSIVCIYAVYAGFETIARFAEIMVYTVILFLIFSTIVAFGTIDYSNVTPILESGFIPVVIGAYSITTAPFMEGFALIMLLSQTRKRRDMSKMILISCVVSLCVMSIIMLRNLMILGFPAIDSLYYPSYIAISLVTLGDFFQRQEVVVSITFLIADMIKIAVLVMFVSKSINFTARTKEYKNYAVAVTFLVLSVSMIIFPTTNRLFEFFDVYKYFLTVSFLIIPLITFLRANKKQQIK